MYLFFDTETTGLPQNWKAPVTNTSNWPRMVQLAWIQYDNQGALVASGNHIIRPEGFTIPADVARIHGITTERALSTGEAIKSVLDLFQTKILASTTLVAHNMSFDEKIVGAEFLRSLRPNYVDGKAKICTMDRTTNYCALPGPYGYKWPKLQELHRKLFGSGFEDAHDAFVDIKITAKCFWELKRKGIV